MDPTNQPRPQRGVSLAKTTPVTKSPSCAPLPRMRRKLRPMPRLRHTMTSFLVHHPRNNTTTTNNNAQCGSSSCDQRAIRTSFSSPQQGLSHCDPTGGIPSTAALGLDASAWDGPLCAVSPRIAPRLAIAHHRQRLTRLMLQPPREFQTKGACHPPSEGKQKLANHSITQTSEPALTVPLPVGVGGRRKCVRWGTPRERPPSPPP